MDWLLPRQAQIERQLAKRQLSSGGLVLYDLTSSYFEGRHCPLGKLGHSRDDKSGKPQIVFGLLTNAPRMSHRGRSIRGRHRRSQNCGVAN
jgi:hypothetical protein